MTRIVRARRKHPLIRLHDSAEAQAMVGAIFRIIGGLAYQPVGRLGDVTVFRVDGPSGSGLMADATEPVEEETGVYRTTVSAWVRPAGDGAGWILDGRFHSWDPGTAALATGDRSLLDGPRRRMYRVRDERTAEVARADDLAIGDLPPHGVPAMMAGLSPDEVRVLAAAFAPELLV
jgi:hypothetical protein